MSGNKSEEAQESGVRKLLNTLSVREMLFLLALFGVGGPELLDRLNGVPMAATEAIKTQTEVLSRRFSDLKTSVDSMRVEIILDRRAINEGQKTIGRLGEQLDSLGDAQVRGFQNLDNYFKGRLDQIED